MGHARSGRSSVGGTALRRVLLVMSSTHEFQRMLLEGVLSFARRAGPWEFIHETLRGESVAMARLADQADGVIAMTTQSAVRKVLASSGRPVVCISGPEPIPGGGWVIINNQRVGELAFEHLYTLGFTHLAFVGTATAWFGTVRGDAFAAAAAEQGLAVRFAPADAARVDPDHNFSPTLRDWLAALPRPVGVFCDNDDIAKHAVHACRSANLRIPDDVAILGVNNDLLSCELMVPPLSSIDHGTRKAGYEAARLLDQLIRGAPVPDEPIVIDPIGVVQRQSTDTLAIDDPVVVETLRLIRTRLREPFTVGDLVSDLDVGRRNLETRFRKAIGRSVHEEITRQRIDMVRQLLAATDLELVQIASRVGFRHISHLCKVFRRSTGQTPTQYRQTHTAG